MTRVIGIGLMLCVAACSKQATQAQEALKEIREPAESKLPAAEIAQLGSKGFAQFQCAAYASFSDTDKAKAEALFTKGRDSLTRFVETAKTVKDKAKDKAVADKVPMIVMQNLGGPSTDFMLGRIWSATMLYAEDELYHRSDWTHQLRDPKAAPPPKYLVEADAAQRFRDHNCELL